MIIKGGLITVNNRIKISTHYSPDIARGLQNFDPGADIVLTDSYIVVKTGRSHVILPIDFGMNEINSADSVYAIIETAIEIVKRIEEQNPNADFIVSVKVPMGEIEKIANPEEPGWFENFVPYKIVVIRNGKVLDW